MGGDGARPSSFVSLKVVSFDYRNAGGVILPQHGSGVVPGTSVARMAAGVPGDGELICRAGCRSSSGPTESRSTKTTHAAAEKFLRGCANRPKYLNMSAYEPEPDRVWDEYEWERFLQQQDHKTEKYMELLEKYLDHPQRDQIIAREMGWTQLLNEEEGDSWNDEVDAMLAEESNAVTGEAGESSGFTDGFEDHTLYRAAFALTVWIDQLFDDQATLQNEPAAVKLATHSALASAKLAAALSDDDVDEIGMTIAYLKRALKAITVSMEAGGQLVAERLITPQQHSVLQQRLFEVRDGIITLMGQYRGEWLRRFGSL